MDRTPKLAAHSDAVMHAVFWATPTTVPPAVAESTHSGQRAFCVARQLLCGGGDRGRTGERCSGPLEPRTLWRNHRGLRSSYILRYTPRGVAPRLARAAEGDATRSFIPARKGYEGS
jgi:hypothetical protein